MVSPDLRCSSRVHCGTLRVDGLRITLTKELHRPGIGSSYERLSCDLLRQSMTTDNIWDKILAKTITCQNPGKGIPRCGEVCCQL
jgi:hypothetical protein